MKTYAQRIREVYQTLEPKHRGYSTGEEVKLVQNTLGLKFLKTELELRNMRDMVVMWFDIQLSSYNEDSNNDSKMIMKLMDKMSAITGVIDNELWNRGYGV